VAATAAGLVSDHSGADLDRNRTTCNDEPYSVKPNYPKIIQEFSPQMSYSDSPEQQRRLREMLCADMNAPPGVRLSAGAIVRRLNDYLIDNDKAGDCIDDEENVAHYIRDYARREKSWKGGHKHKKHLWDFYEARARAAADSALRPSVDIPPSNLFVRTTGAPSCAPILGKFFVYKRAITEPHRLAVRGFIEFSQATNESTRIDVTEIHLNRTQKPRTHDVMKEIWTGSVTPRERSYCMITQESKKGTPKLAVFETLSVIDGQAQTMRGYSIECVENWGSVNIFHSGLFFERVDDNLECDTCEEVDLVLIASLRKTHDHVIGHLGEG
jgi:hypothetical protein